MSIIKYPPEGSGGGGGSVNSVSAGTNVTITGTSTDPVVNAQNIYTNDGTIISNRTVTFNTFNLTFDMNSTGRLNLGAHQFRGDNNIVEFGRLDANANLGLNVGIDFCSTTGDFNSRILRDGGVDGWFNIQNTGTGEMNFVSNGLATLLLHANRGIQFYNYGTGIYTGIATKYLAVDALGEVIEQDPPGIPTPVIQNESIVGTVNNLVLNANTTVLRLSSTGGTLTGITGGTSGRQITIQKIGGSTLTLNNEDVGSSGANRIGMANFLNMSLSQSEDVILTYDSTLSLWKVSRRLVSVDNVTITGTGDEGNPLVALSSGVQTVTGNLVDNTDPINPVVNLSSNVETVQFFSDTTTTNTATFLSVQTLNADHLYWCEIVTNAVCTGGSAGTVGDCMVKVCNLAFKTGTVNITGLSNSGANFGQDTFTVNDFSMDTTFNDIDVTVSSPGSLLLQIQYSGRVDYDIDWNFKLKIWGVPL